MQRDADRYQSSIKAIEREYRAMRLAADRLKGQASVDTSILQEAGIRIGDVGRASANLEATYFIRLFAAFESALRDYWKTIRDTHPKMEDLVNGVESRRRIRGRLIREVHVARTYRNTLVHEQDASVPSVSIAEARRSTCLYLGYLP